MFVIVCGCLCGAGVGFTVSVWGFQSFGLVMFGAPGTALPGTALPGTALPGTALPLDALPLDRPKFRSFFSVSRRKIRSFLPSLGVFSLNSGGVFEFRDPQMCTFGLCDCRVKPWRLRGRRGFTRQPENSKRAHLSAPALQTPPKFHEKTPREGRKERILRRDSEKKVAPPFGPPPFEPPPFEPPPFEPPPFEPPPFEPPPFEPPPFKPPPFEPPSFEPPPFESVWPKSIGQSRFRPSPPRPPQAAPGVRSQHHHPWAILFLPTDWRAFRKRPSHTRLCRKVRYTLTPPPLALPAHKPQPPCNG